MIFIMAFLGAITPGPDILLVLQTALKCGFKRALITLGGIASGWIIYLLVLYFGLAGFFSNNISQICLSALGAAYLLYLSYLLFSKPKNELDFDKSTQGGYLKGLIINLSNPKAILFFAVIVAPFLNKNLELNLAMLFLGLISAFLLVIFLAIYLRRFLTNRLFNVVDKICAIAFLIFAILLIINVFRGIL